eukprot:Em0011g78a
MTRFKNFLHTAFSPPYLLYTSTGVSAVIELIGDYLEQKVEGVSPYDTGRGIRMTTTAIVAGPPYYFWYRMLDRRFPGRTGKIIFKKVLLDQTVLSPIMIVAFYVGMCRMEGKNHEQSMRELKDKFWFTYKLDCMIWPLAQWFNFYFLPPSLRVIYTETINVGHSMFFSRFKHIDQKEREAKERALLEEAARTQQMVATSQPVDLHPPHPDTRPSLVHTEVPHKDALQPSDPPPSHLDRKGQNQS